MKGPVLAMVSASFATWFWVDPTSRSRSAPVSSGGQADLHSEIIRSLREVLEERDQHIAHLKAGKTPQRMKQSDWRALLEVISSQMQEARKCVDAETHDAYDGGLPIQEATLAASLRAVQGDSPVPKLGDPLSELSLATQHSAALVGDALRFALDSVRAQVWPWPLEAGNAQSIDSKSPAGSASRLHSSQTRSDQSDGAGLAGSLQEAAQGLFAMVPSWLRTPIEALADIVRAPLRSCLNMFLERYPEHKAFVESRDPILVVLLLFALLHIMVWELFGLWQLVSQGVPAILCCPFRCCRSSKSQPKHRARSHSRGRHTRSRRAAARSDDAEESEVASEACTPDKGGASETATPTSSIRRRSRNLAESPLADKENIDMSANYIKAPY